MQVVDDRGYKLMKNDYENCLAVRSYEPNYHDSRHPLYLQDLIEPQLIDQIQDAYSIAYTHKNPFYYLEDETSPLVVDYFIHQKGYSYRFHSLDIK